MKVWLFWQRFKLASGRTIRLSIVSIAEVLAILILIFCLSSQLPQFDSLPLLQLPSPAPAQSCQPSTPTPAIEQPQPIIPATGSNTVIIRAVVAPVKLVYVNNRCIIMKIVSNTQQNISPTIYLSSRNEQILTTAFINQQYAAIASSNNLNQVGYVYQMNTKSSTAIVHLARSLTHYVSALRLTNL